MYSIVRGTVILCTQYTLLENLTDDVIAEIYVTKCLTISLYLAKLYVTYSFAIASSVKYNEIRQNFSYSGFIFYS